MKIDPGSGARSRPGWNRAWLPDAASYMAMSSLTPGTRITVAKWSPAGEEVSRYPAVVAPTAAPSPWVEVEAIWAHRRVDVSGLVFEPGDSLREFFSPLHPFNAFAVYAPDSVLRGWYGNVTYPAFVVHESSGPVLVWHDLYLDAVILLDGTTHLLDDDELEASGLPASSPAFAAAIVQARDDLLATIPAFTSSMPIGQRET